MRVINEEDFYLIFLNFYFTYFLRLRIKARYMIQVEKDIGFKGAMDFAGCAFCSLFL